MENGVSTEIDGLGELGFGEGGIRIGEPLQEFHGVLTGTPIYSGSPDRLLAQFPANVTE